ncbi:hypothetical protein TrVE_jg655 [Triparma verrucosa]|uniref:Uncharacterized protein n=1 Tax=Triparma verrucosa TaxID=1606542 RepID=A0A9W7FPT0_9STRA|nr:hypothetical protein TrVE_jg655 [Triparma verrucosa]
MLPPGPTKLDTGSGEVFPNPDWGVACGPPSLSSCTGIAPWNTSDWDTCLTATHPAGGRGHEHHTKGDCLRVREIVRVEETTEDDTDTLVGVRAD